MKSIVLFATVLRIILITAIISFVIIANAQSVAVNTTGNSADASAVLDVSSNSKGFLAPRMTTLQRTGISSPANGLMVFDTDSKTYWYYSDVWKEVTNAGGSGSFVLPYTGAFAAPAKLFSITNSDSSNGAAAIYGKSGSSGIGITPGINMGIWGDNSRGIGVLGTSERGVGIYGVSFQNHGISGYSTSNAFAGIYGSHADSGAGILGTGNAGIGVKGISSSNYAMYGETNSSAFAGVYGTNTSGTFPGVAVKGEITGAGIAINGVNSSSGNAARFEITNSANNSDAVQINNNGLGRGIYTNTLNTNNNANAAHFNTNGTGRALYATISNTNNSTNAAQISTNGLGRALDAIISNANNTQAALAASTNGMGSALYADISNVNSNADGIHVSTTGSGKALHANIENVNSASAAVYAKSLGMMAVEAISNGIGVKGFSSSLNNGIGVIGESVQGANGIGVKGICKSTVLTSGAVTGINTSSGVAVYAESTGGGTAVYGKTTKQNGAAIYGINNAVDGQAIRGSATGEDGVAIYGEAGNSNSNSRAAYFRNANSSSSKNVIQIDNLGTGNFLSLQDGFGDEKTTISKNGNIKTDGTMTVKNNKGIIRNTGSSQLRYEVIPFTASGAVLHVNESLEFNINFPTPFGATPAVTLGNVLSVLADAVYVIGAIGNVTSTGCKLVVRNAGKHDFYLNTTWNLIAIGQE